MPNYGLLARQGRREDNAAMGGQVAHISAVEAELLRLLGGAGTTNPVTGLPEYQSGMGFAYSGPGVVGRSGPGGPGPGGQSGVLGVLGDVGYQTEGGGGMGFVVGGGESTASQSALGGSVSPGDTSYTPAGNWIGAPTFGQVFAAKTFAPNSPMNTANPFAAYNMGYSPYTVAPPSMTFAEALAVLGPIAFSLATGGVGAAALSVLGTVAQAAAKGGTFGKSAAAVANAVAGITGAPQGTPGSVSYAKTGASKGGIGSAVTGSAPTPTLVQAIAESTPEEEKEVTEAELYNLGFPEGPLTEGQETYEKQLTNIEDPAFLAQFSPAIQDVLLDVVRAEKLKILQAEGLLA